MLGFSTKLVKSFRRVAIVAAVFISTNILTGCTSIDKLQKTHEAIVTLQEADRQFSIEDTTDGAVPDDREAIKWINRAISLMPHSDVPYVGDDSGNPGLVIILQNRGRYPLMIGLLKKALSDPALSDNPDLLLDLADAEERSGPSAEATQAYEKADAAIDKTLSTAGSTISNNGLLLLDRARAEYYGGKKAQAITDFNTVIATQPDYESEAQNDLAYFEALDKSNLTQAKVLATRAVASARSSGDEFSLGMFDDTLAWVYYQSGDNSNALLYEEEAATLDPLVSDIQFHLGQICQASGRDGEAHLAYRSAIKLDPFYPGIKTAIASVPASSE